MFRNIFRSAIISHNRLGQKKLGVERGPTQLKKFLYKDIPIFELKERHTLLNNLNSIYKENANVKGSRINIGGDHSTTIATGAYTLNTYKNPKFVWFDAHGDINSYASSPTKNYHGMVLSYLSGLSYNKPDFIKTFLSFHNLMYIGIRDLDPYENILIKSLNVPIVTVNELNTNPELSIKKIKDFVKDDPIHLSFDVDVMDPSLISSTGTPVENGLFLEQTKHVLENIIDKQVVNLDICEFNPDLGNSKHSLNNVVNIWKNIIME
tara:strand:- start:3230 stop:4024 length:795 start_codon:yes stop_codon:yes gene_type:complete